MQTNDSTSILPQPMQLSRFWLFVAWVICGIGMLGMIRNTPLTRTQEARVVVSAREMIGQPWQRWMIPTANGEARLRKPPLAYWMSAVSYEIFGYSTTSARVPAWLATWFTLGFTFLIGKRLFDSWTGFYAAGCLLASWFFVRYGLLAETDTLVMCMMTAGIYFLLRARDDAKPARWLYLIALMIALMALTKGPPAAYLLLVVVLVDFADGRFKKSTSEPSLTLSFFKSGAFLLALIVALPWFIYAFKNIEGGQLTDDLSNSALGGKGHSGYPWAYLPMLMQAFLPWTILWLASGLVILKSIKDKTITRPIIFTLIWGGAILVPLLAWGNKQPHYLVPFLPAGMVAIGWIIRECNRRDNPTAQPIAKMIVNGMLVIAIIISMSMVVLIPILGKKIRGVSDPADMQSALRLAGALIMIFVVGQFLKHWKLPEISIISVASLLMVIKTFWLPTFEPNTPASIAEQLRTDFPDAKLVFRNAASLPLCAELQQIIPVMDDQQLQSTADNDLICIAASENSKKELPGYRTLYSISKGENPVVISVREGSRYEHLEPKNSQP